MFLVFECTSYAHFLTLHLRLLHPHQSAIEADNAKDYVKAKNLYLRGIDFLVVYLKWTKNEHERKMLKERVNGYISRVEVLKKAIEEKDDAAEEAKKAGSKGTGDKEGKKPKAKPCKKIDIEEEFKKLIGMDDIKTEIRMMKREIMLDQRRRDLGMDMGKLEVR